jgi:hypothetical protein
MLSESALISAVPLFRLCASQGIQASLESAKTECETAPQELPFECARNEDSEI